MNLSAASRFWETSVPRVVMNDHHHGRMAHTKTTWHGSWGPKSIVNPATSPLPGGGTPRATLSGTGALGCSQGGYRSATTNLVSLKARPGIPAKHCSSGRNVPGRGLPFSLVVRRTKQARLGLPGGPFQRGLPGGLCSACELLAGCGPTQQLSESLPNFDSRRCRSGRSALDSLAD